MEIHKPNPSMDWVTLQCTTTLDIDCPIWLDWFHGGLQFQIEHHLFPRIPRYRLRQIKKRVKSLCLNYNLPYHEPGFLRANVELIQTLRNIANKAWNWKEGGSIDDKPSYNSCQVLWDSLNARG